MSRPLRVEYSGAIYHIMARGNDKKAIFLDDRDRRLFLRLLRSAVFRFGFKIHAYALMPNHYHLLMETPMGKLSQGMHVVNSAYAFIFNKNHERVGHLFQGRYKAILVERESYFLILSRYIHLNPVKGGLVIHPEDYFWSSCQDYLRLRRPPSWLEMATTFELLPGGAVEHSISYRDFLSQTGDSYPEKEVFGQFYLGHNLEFAVGLAHNVKNTLENDSEFPRIRMVDIQHDRLTHLFINTVANNFNISPSELKGGRWCRSPAKWLAIYLLREDMKLSLRATGKYFGLSPSRVSRGLRKQEQLIVNDVNLRLRLDLIRQSVEKAKRQDLTLRT